MIDGGPDECIPCYNKNIPLCVSVSFTVAVCLRCNKVDAEWLSGRMPDSRAREHRHESSYGLHIGAVDGDSLWRRYAMTTQNHCTCYFVINRDL